MPVYRLSSALAFPSPELADPSGLLAVGGDLSPDRLLLAYMHGIFPWFSEGDPILWHAPPERMVLYPDELRVNRSLRKTLRRGTYEVRLDTAFAEVISACQCLPRADQDGTWITDDMLQAYVRLHELGFAHSVESWHEGELVGGLYGVSVGAVFCGESMFSLMSDASKVALCQLVAHLKAWDFALIDCQVHTPLLASLGARLIPRASYGAQLARAVKAPMRRGRWSLNAAARD